MNYWSLILVHIIEYLIAVFIYLVIKIMALGKFYNVGFYALLVQLYTSVSVERWWSTIRPTGQIQPTIILINWPPKESNNSLNKILIHIYLKIQRIKIKNVWIFLIFLWLMANYVINQIWTCLAASLIYLILYPRNLIIKITLSYFMFIWQINIFTIINIYLVKIMYFIYIHFLIYKNSNFKNYCMNCICINIYNKNLIKHV